MKTYNQDQLDALVVSFRKIQDVQCTQKEELYYLFQLFALFFESITDHQNISFTTLFSRIAFSSVHFNYPNSLVRENHQFRRQVEKGGILEENLSEIYKFGVYVLWLNLEHIGSYERPKHISKPFVQEETVTKRSKGYRRVIKAYVIEAEIINSEYEIIYFDELEPHIKKTVSLVNDAFNKQFARILKHIKLPFVVNFIDVNIFDSGKREAKAFVYKPDLLIGVTSISECFQHDGASPLFYLAKKLLPQDYSIHMLTGNIVNYCLDELVNDSDLKFTDLYAEIFQLAPLDFARMEDEVLKSLLQKTEKHFDSLKSVVKEELIETGITKDKAYLEPTFYSPEYGVQGRLDMYHFNLDKKQSDIIELKSGKLFKANGYGLNENHYVQTLLYDLIMESVYDGKVRSNNYILYSYLDSKRLRYAPRVRSKQYSAMGIRNDIVLIENLLMDASNEMFTKVIEALEPEKIPGNYNFLKRDAKLFYEAYNNVSALEKAYYSTFLSFINREFHYSKVGRHGVYKSNGLASLWLDPINEKIDNFRILSYLKIEVNHSHKKLPVIELRFSKRSSHLSRFRIGDIAVFYPDDGGEHSAIRNQIFKCTIIALEAERISIRLRARQKNFDVFQQFEFWHLEGDVLDGGFNLQFHSLLNFLRSNQIYKSQILGTVAPPQQEYEEAYSNSKLTAEQLRVVNEAIVSRDYFLLWGPPGTGKTSVMIKSFVDYYYNQTNLNIVLLAYTNRAVDEICEAIDMLLNGQYIRIGSRYATKEKFKSKLLSQMTDDIKTRRVLQDKLRNNRVYVSTISSFQGKADLKDICESDIVIVDEASQLLEPMLNGLLSKFKKYILIGDHKQLPAVVSQDIEGTEVKSILLLEQTNLKDLRTSLFERMYMNSIQKDWHWTYGALSYQGRMHEDILKFVSHEFYDGKLKVMEGIERLIGPSKLVSSNALQDLLISKRMIFIDTPIDEALIKKTNEIEARLASKLVEIWIEIYRQNDVEIDLETIGVITPFRSQIALIADKMENDILKNITLDTIERYQGGSRNHIIISLAISQAQLLDSISNESDEGIDRKLNVALTRAKENIIIMGAKEILVRKPIYKKLIEYCTEVNYESILNYNIE